jgi:hypothetical protein
MKKKDEQNLEKREKKKHCLKLAKISARMLYNIQDCR